MTCYWKGLGSASVVQLFERSRSVWAGPLNVNMDETGIRLFQAAGAGNMVVEAARLRGHGLRPVQNMNKHQERSNLGDLVMVCDDPAVTSAAAGNYFQHTCGLNGKVS